MFEIVCNWMFGERCGDVYDMVHWRGAGGWVLLTCGGVEVRSINVVWKHDT